MKFIIQRAFNPFEEVDLNSEHEMLITTFGLPAPEFLEVSLSYNSIQKIKNILAFMKENKILKSELYLRDDNFFNPIKENSIFHTNEYLDFGNVFFRTFKNDVSKITIDTFYEKISFQFFYSNDWTEHVFDFDVKISTILN